MAARYCSHCDDAWPPDTEFSRCPRCARVTMWNFNRAADHNVAEARDIRNAVQRPAPQVGTVELPVVEPTSYSPAYEHRVERYLHLGFTEAEAHMLASATEQEDDSTGRTWVRALNWLRVDKALAAGCTHAQALNIFT